jgi:hypothetical protein
MKPTPRDTSGEVFAAPREEAVAPGRPGVEVIAWEAGREAVVHPSAVPGPGAGDLVWEAGHGSRGPGEGAGRDVEGLGVEGHGGAERHPTEVV